MTVICNGCPKTGTHALIKAVQLLGFTTLHGHFVDAVPAGKHIHIFRNPRNVLVSWVRFTRPNVTQGFLIEAMQKYHKGGAFLDEYMEYGKFLSDPAVLSVQFEKLIADDAEMRRIAAFLETPYLADAFPNLLGRTPTWTGALSDWSEHWSPEVDAAWIANGGPEIEAAFGYAV